MASYIVQATLVTGLVFFTLTAPTKMPTEVEHIELVAPELSEAPRSEPVKAVKIGSVPPAKIAPAPIATAPPKVAPPVLQVQQPQRVRKIEVAEVAQPQIVVAQPKLDTKVLNTPRMPSKIIATNTFGSSAAPTLQKVAPSKVQTGGFGDPNGVPSSAHGSNRSTIAAAGSFDMPAGSGYGNGSGGTSGIRGTVASAGFGNGVAAQHTGNSTQAHIQSTSFANSVSTASADERKVKAVGHQVLSAPVSIQSKPTPVYTSEARQLRVEGEVLLNVVFTADGQIRILNVVRGLGHGLDEAAQHAAKGVRFSPAMRDGHPVDSNATLHIVFQLS